MDRSRRRMAFTLVELLVVIAIIGILVALLLPAVQAAREAARRTQCVNQIKQFATGCLNHESFIKHYPTGGWGWDWVGDADRGYGQDQPGGWIYNILPFIEEQAKHDLPKDGKPYELTDQQKLGAGDMLIDPITILYCPTRRSGVYRTREGYGINARVDISKLLSPVARSDYAANAGDVSIGGGQGGPGIGALRKEPVASNWLTTNKVGLLAVQPTGMTNAKLTGISFQRSEVGVRHVTDGTSTTYLVGEKYLNPVDYETGRDGGDNETWCTGHNNDNFRTTNLPPFKDTPFVEYDTRFGSNHDSIWNVSFCDGHVEAISYDIDPLVHKYNGNREDGVISTE